MRGWYGLTRNIKNRGISRLTRKNVTRVLLWSAVKYLTSFFKRKGVHPDRVFVWEFPSSQLGGTLATNSGIPPRRLFIWRLQLHGPVNRDNSF